MKDKLKYTIVGYYICFLLGLHLVFPYKSSKCISINYGVFFFVLSIIFLISIYRITNQKNNFITSKLTAFYKLLVTQTLIILFLFILMLISFNLYPGKDMSYYIVICIMLLIIIYKSFFNINIYHLTKEDDKFIFYNFKENIVIEKKQVVDIKRYKNLYYKIITVNKTFLILPKNSILFKTIADPRKLLNI